MKKDLIVVTILISCAALLQSCFFSPPGVSSIGFWGKIIDQDGDPVSDVDILYYAGGGYFGGGSGYGRLKSNEKGLFNISGRSGGSVNFREMDKEGYQITFLDGENIFRSWSKEHQKSKIWGDYDQNNPNIFYAWKINDNFNDPSVLKRGVIRARFDSDIKGYTIDLYGGPRQNKKQEFTDAHLRFNFFRQYDADGIATKDFKLTITSIKGGIQKTHDRYTNEAPTAGYKKSISYSQVDCERNTCSNSLHDFYFTTDGGKNFGRAKLEFNLRQNRNPNSGYFHLDFSLNPTGQVYLESFDGWTQ